MINLDPLGNIGEFLGATAVVISLLYLARQVSQNTDYIRASNYRALAEAVNQLNRLILESASLPRLIVAAAQGREAFSDEDWIRYSAFINQAALTFELALTRPISTAPSSCTSCSARPPWPWPSRCTRNSAACARCCCRWSPVWSPAA
jgi:hypothetical protein